MGYTVADMFNLFQFNEGLTGMEVCRQAGIKPTQMQFAKAENVLTKKTNEQMVRRFGEGWNGIENLRKYQEKKNIVKDFDCDRMKELRLRRGGTIKEYSKILGIGHNRLVNIESGISILNNWKEYLKLKKFYKDDLLIKESAVKKKNTKVVTKEFITFKNVGGRWEMGKLVKREVV